MGDLIQFPTRKTSDEDVSVAIRTFARSLGMLAALIYAAHLRSIDVKTPELPARYEAKE